MLRGLGARLPWERSREVGRTDPCRPGFRWTKRREPVARGRGSGFLRRGDLPTAAQGRSLGVPAAPAAPTLCVPPHPAVCPPPSMCSPTHSLRPAGTQTETPDSELLAAHPPAAGAGHAGGPWGGAAALGADPPRRGHTVNSVTRSPKTGRDAAEKRGVELRGVRGGAVFPELPGEAASELF